MKSKLLKVAGVLAIFAASGLAEFPLGIFGYPTCC